jgi:hypothetical protein
MMATTAAPIPMPTGSSTGGTIPTSVSTTTSTSMSTTSSTTNMNPSTNPSTSIDDVPVRVPVWISQLPVPQLTMTLYIPTMCVGAVIGRRGSTIAQIQKQAQQLAPNAPPVRVSIVGHHTSNVATATTTAYGSEGEGKVEEALTHHPSPGGPTTTSPPTPIPTTTTALQPPTSPPPPNDATTTATTATTATTTITATPGDLHPSSVPYTYTPLDWSDPAWTPVVIRADPAAALHVAQKLEPLCRHYNTNTNTNSMTSSAATAAAAGCLQDTIVDVPIGRQRHAAIVGKRGVTLMQLSADHQTRIWVPPKELKLDVLQLEGPLDHCVATLKALTLLLAHGGGTGGDNTYNTNTYNHNTYNTNASSTSTNNHNNKSHKATHQVQITVGQLPSGTKLRSVGRKTDTLIKKKKMDKDDSWQLTILGNSEAQVQGAYQLLQKWSEGGGGGGSEPTSGTTPLNTTTTTTTTGIPPSATSTTTTNNHGGRGAGNNNNKGRGGGSGRGGGPGRGKPRKGKPRGGGKASSESYNNTNNNNSSNNNNRKMSE